MMERLTIDDGICENCLSKNNCDVLPYSNNCNEVRAMLKHDKEVYNKAIDDFVNKINERNQGHWRPTRYEHGEVVSETMSYDIGTIRLIAEQLKAGGIE